jgi:ATP/maltotriose-dependent transcriptional regulator MalT
VLDSVEARTILLVAPAGYGKTTLARQWLEQVGGAWVTVTAASEDVPVLARELAAAIASITDLDVRRIESALRAGRTPTEQASAVARTILSQVTTPTEKWIVVDDYQMLGAKSAAEELFARLERSGRFRLLITSRVRPAWATSRQRIYLETVELGSSELAFDDDEVRQLLPPDRGTSTLRKQARGWPAVIGLASHLQASDVRVSPEALSVTLYDYFAEELFERTRPDVQRGLTALAVLPQLDRGEVLELVGVDPAELLPTGLAYEVNGMVGVHPLAQAFLLAKLREGGDTSSVREKAFELALTRGFYDHAFGLICALGMNDHLEQLVTASYVSLLETGRIATIVRFGSYAEAHGNVSQAVIDLIAAETNLVAGRVTEARTLAESAAQALPDHHPLKARACLTAARAAHLSSHHEEALDLFVVLKQLGGTASEANEGAWGAVSASLVLEMPGLEEAFAIFEALPNKRLTDRVRLEAARLGLARIHGTKPNTLEGSRLAAQTADPWVRSAWSHVHGYALLLGARYAEAEAVLRDALAELEEFGLSFATHHLEWTLAASELGLRRFNRCESILRRVQRRPQYSRDVHSQLNVRALQARVHLAQQRPGDALDLTVDDFKNPSSPAMYSEYLATRAMSLAALGRAGAAADTADEAVAVSRSAETRIFAAAVSAVLSVGNPDSAEERVTALLEQASTAGIWDSVVCAIRTAPRTLEWMSQMSQYRTELGEVLVRANEFGLASSLGEPIRRPSVGGPLSPRETEVMEHLKQGKKNAEIAASLFISTGTVKRHLDHIYDKLGTRSRGGAIARYAEIETGETTRSTESGESASDWP